MTLDLFPKLPKAETRGTIGKSSQAPLTVVREAPPTAQPGDVTKGRQITAVPTSCSASPVNVGIYECTAGLTTWKWLCDPCAENRRDDGWSLKLLRVPGGLGCDDCALRAAGEVP